MSLEPARQRFEGTLGRPHQFLVTMQSDGRWLREVVRELPGVDGLEFGFFSIGFCDVVALFSADTPYDMGQIVVDGVKSIPGVVKAEVHYIFDKSDLNPEAGVKKMPFFVFVGCDRGVDKRETMGRLVRIGGVAQAYGLFGRFDAAVCGTIDTGEELRDVLLNEIFATEGVISTSTVVCNSQQIRPVTAVSA